MDDEAMQRRFVEAVLAASKPKIGTRSTCRMCNNPIEYVGPYWRHVGEMQPRHPALSFNDPPPDDPAAALSLLAAVPPERRAAVGARLLKALGYEPATATMVLLSFEDVWRLVVEVGPHIRDAVMEEIDEQR